MNIDLTPNGRPSAFSDVCARPGETLFEPVLFNGGANILAGGPRLLAVFNTKGGKEWELPSKTEHGIAGFCLFAGIFYVQDGPVLSAWNGLQQTMLAARNLSTGVTWAGQGQALDKDFYDYSDDDADAATQLLTASNRHSWASVLAGLASSNDQPARTLSQDIRQRYGFSGQDASAIKADAAASLDSVKKSVAKIVFSAPVTRQHRRAGASGNIVFTLGMNGALYAMDEQLKQVAQVTRGDDLPLLPQLAIGEPQADNDAHLCRLYYMTVSGGITVLDGVSSDLSQQRGWSGAPPQDLGKVLPLSYQDGVLMGGGILGADFFVADIRQPNQLAHSVARPDQCSWTSYRADTRSKLVVLSNGDVSRLFAYGAGVVTRDRWGLRRSKAQVHLAIAETASREQAAPWVIETDVGTIGGEQPCWRALFINTVDTPKINPLYQPVPFELASGTLKAHTVNSKVSYGWIRSRPLVNQTDIFCVVRTHEPALLQAGHASGADGLAETLYDLQALQQQLDRHAHTGLLRASAELEAPAAGKVRDALVNFDLKVHALKLRTEAEAEHKRMLLRAEAIPGAIVHLTVYKDAGIGINPVSKAYGPVPLGNATLELALQPSGEKISVTTDRDGLFYLSRAHVGKTMSVTDASMRAIRLPPLTSLTAVHVNSEPFTVSGSTPPTLAIYYTGKANSRFPHLG